MNVCDIIVWSNGHGNGVKDVVELPRNHEFFSAMHMQESAWQTLDATSTCSVPSVGD